MIHNFRELTRRSGHAFIVVDVNFQECGFASLLGDLLRCFTAGMAIPRSDKHVKAFLRELKRDLAPDTFVRSGD